MPAAVVEDTMLQVGRVAEMWGEMGGMRIDAVEVVGTCTLPDQGEVDAVLCPERPVARKIWRFPSHAVMEYGGVAVAPPTQPCHP